MFSAKETLLNIASDWAIRRFDDIFGNKKYRSEPGLIESIINKCVTLGAETQVNYYRLAFLRCLADDKDGALKWLKKAEESEHPLFGPKRNNCIAYSGFWRVESTNNKQ